MGRKSGLFPVGVVVGERNKNDNSSSPLAFSTFIGISSVFSRLPRSINKFDHYFATPMSIESDIRFIELSLNLRKTPVFDRISSYPMLKIQLKKKVLNSYNKMFLSCIPQHIRNSVAVPILKSGNNKTLAKPYRPNL